MRFASVPRTVSFESKGVRYGNFFHLANWRPTHAVSFLQNDLAKREREVGDNVYPRDDFEYGHSASGAKAGHMEQPYRLSMCFVEGENRLRCRLNHKLAVLLGEEGLCLRGEPHITLLA